MKSKMHIVGWLVCALGALYYAYEYVLRILPSVMEGQLRDHFQLNAAGFGLLSAFYYYAYVPMQLPVGVFMDRFGPRRLLTLACIVCVAGAWLFSSTTVFSVAAIARLLVGAGSAFAFVGVLKLGTIWLPESRLALVAGTASALGTIGAMLGDNYLGQLVATVGWHKASNLTVIIGLIMILVLWFGIHDHKRDTLSGGTISNLRLNLIDLGLIARNKQIWVNGMYGCLVYLPTTVFAELWGIPYLHHAHHLNVQQADFANSMLFLGFTCGAPLMGYVSDKLRRRILPMQIGAFGAAIMMMIVLYAPGHTAHSLNICLFILGLFYGAEAIVFAVGRELSPAEAGGTAMALTNMIVMLGAIFLQPVIGRFLDISAQFNHLGKLSLAQAPSLVHTAYDYQLALSVVPIGIFIAAILTFFLRETHAYVNDTTMDKV